MLKAVSKSVEAGTMCAAIHVYLAAFFFQVPAVNIPLILVNHFVGQCVYKPLLTEPIWYQLNIAPTAIVLFVS